MPNRDPQATSTKLFWIAEWLRKDTWPDEAKLVYDAGNLYLATEQADVQKPERAMRALEDLRGSMSWALPQYKCGNMSEKAIFDYMFFCISRVSPDVTMRALVERLRLAISERDHLRYFEQSNPDIFKTLIREVLAGDWTDVAYAVALPSRLAETHWYARARAALEGSGLSQPSEALAKEAAP